MNEVLEQKIKHFLDTATGESIIAECEQYGIELEDIVNDTRTNNNKEPQPKTSQVD